MGFPLFVDQECGGERCLSLKTMPRKQSLRQTLRLI
jgi:hypothetical protein